MAGPLNSPPKCQGRCIIVGTFCPINSVIELPIIPGLSTTRSLKKSLAERLGLSPGCQNIFGLFVGEELTSSVKVLQEEDVLTANVLEKDGKNYFLQKNPIDLVKEISVLKSDEVARNMVYHELREVYHRKLIYPPPNSSQEDEFMQLIQKADSNPSEQMNFLNYIWKELKPSYDVFYHRVENCTLQSKVTAAEPNATTGSLVNVSVNFENLVITYTNEKGDPFHFTFQWDKVRMIDMDRSKYCATFEVFLDHVPGEKHDNILRAICIKSERYEYLYSVAKYVLLIHKNLANFEKELYDEMIDLSKNKAKNFGLLLSRVKNQEITSAWKRVKEAEDKSLAKQKSKPTIEIISEEESSPVKVQPSVEGQQTKKKRCAAAPVVDQARQNLRIVSDDSGCVASPEEQPGSHVSPADPAQAAAKNSTLVELSSQLESLFKESFKNLPSSKRAVTDKVEHPADTTGHSAVCLDSAVAYYKRYMEDLCNSEPSSGHPNSDVEDGGSEQLLERTGINQRLEDTGDV